MGIQKALADLNDQVPWPLSLGIVANKFSSLEKESGTDRHTLTRDVLGPLVGRQDRCLHQKAWLAHTSALGSGSNCSRSSESEKSPTAGLQLRVLTGVGEARR